MAVTKKELEDKIVKPAFGEKKEVVKKEYKVRNLKKVPLFVSKGKIDPDKTGIVTHAEYCNLSKFVVKV